MSRQQGQARRNRAVRRQTNLTIQQYTRMILRKHGDDDVDEDVEDAILSLPREERVKPQPTAYDEEAS